MLFSTDSPAYPSTRETKHSSLHTTFVGVEHPASSTINQYRGIKYANASRFCRPTLWTSYPLMTDATEYGPICPQPQGKTVEEEMFGLSEGDSPIQALRQDEDECLNLNITCPADLQATSRVPVMIWIHGGGDRGSGSSWVYDPAKFVMKSVGLGKPVIVVTFNYRLGLFGFASSPALRGHHGDCGNYGLLDQRKAMEWVSRYISDFGGDPSRVTLFGHATGAADIIWHLLSAKNQSHPLFHRAVIQSPIIDVNLPDANSAGWQLSRIMTAVGASSVDDFRTVPAEALFPYGQCMRVVDDGAFLAKGWKSAFEIHSHHRTHSHTPRRHHHHQQPQPQHHQHHQHQHHATTVSLSLPDHLQPLIIGDCATDATPWVAAASKWTVPALTRRLRAVCQSLYRTSLLLRGYDLNTHTSSDKELRDRILDFISDSRVSWPSEIFAQTARHERNGRGIWRFVFDQEGHTRGTPHHAADLEYLFDNVPRKTGDCPSPELFYEGRLDVDDDEDNFDLMSGMSAPPPLDLELSTVEREKSSGSDGDVSMLGSSPDLFRYGTRKLSFGNDFDDDDSAGDVFSDHFEDTANGTNNRWQWEEDEAWTKMRVDDWSFSRVRDAMQSCWVAFAYGEAPWTDGDDRVFVFGPEGETGERSESIFDARRQRALWREVLQPLGLPLVQKIGLELANGPTGAASR